VCISVVETTEHILCP